MKKIIIPVLLLFALPISAGEWTSKRIKVKVTAYCPCEICCGRFADGKTFTERDADKAGVAVDPNVFPLGSRFDIPGYNRGTNKNGSWILADDIGAGVQGYHIDIRFKTHEEAVKWGVKYLTVRIWTKTK